MSKPSLTIFSVASEDYLDEIEVLLKSASINLPDVPFFVELVNCSEKQMKNLKAKHPNVEIQIETRDFASVEDRRIFCAGRRSALFMTLRQQRPDDILLWMDSDTLIRKPPKGLIEFLSSCDVAVRKRDTETRKMLDGQSIDYLQSGIFAIGPNKACQEFMEMFHHLVNRKKYWFADQDALSIACYRFGHKQTLKIGFLPEEYSDFRYNKKSSIWHCKGKTKDDPKNDPFWAEVKKFR